MTREDESRRSFLQGLTFCSAGALLVPAAYAQESKEKHEGKEKEEEEEMVTPGEDLMREHGVLNRVLLVYEECVRRIEGKQDLDPQIVAGSADIVRTFIEEYHEKQEEDFIFPLMRKANTLTDLVDVLDAQHKAGRRVTEKIRGLATAAALKDEAQSRELTDAIRQFVRMYRPHESREDTVLFPTLQKMMEPEEYKELGEQFEKREHEKFGEGGFQEYVEKAAALERAVGIFELAQFTPKVE